MMLDPQQRELLQRLTATQQSRFPTSAAQRRQWLLQQLDEDDTSYAVPVALRLRGLLDREALQRALADLVIRHEGLRTTFPAEDGAPVQVVHASAAVPLVLRAGAPSLAQLQAEVARPFDLAAGPLARLILWTAAPESHTLLVVLHHIVADGWSIEILLRDLAVRYRMQRTGVDEPLPVLALHPADYAAWESDQVVDPSALVAELQDLPPRLGLSSGADRRACTVRTSLDEALTAQVRDLATRSRTTEFAVLLGAFAAVLGRSADRDDLMIGTPISGRTRRELTDVVGCFVNTLPVRVRMAVDEVGSALLEAVHERLTHLLHHQDVPLDVLVEHLGGSRDTGHLPWFDVLFTLQDTLQLTQVFDGVIADPVLLDPVDAKFDLQCVARREGGRTTIQWTFREGGLDRVAVESLAAAFAGLLRWLVEHPDGVLGDAFTTLALPRLPTGRRRSAEPSAPEVATGQALTSAQRPIADVWAAVLGVDATAIGPDDDFFALGGQSFLAARVAARLSRSLDVEVGVREMFEHRTLAALERHLRQAGPVADGQVVTRSDPPMRSGPLSFAQERLYFLATLDPLSPAYNIPLVAQLDGPLDVAALRSALTAVLTRHDVLRSRFGTTDGEPVQWIVDDAHADFDVRDVSAQPDPWSAGRELVDEHAYRPFDIVSGASPVRALLVHLNDDAHLVAVTVHHLVADGTAVRVLVGDLCAAYAGGGRLPAPDGTRYLDFAAWQRGWFTGDRLNQGLEYWQRQLAGAPQTLDLPSTRPRPAVRRSHGESLPIAVDDALTARVRQLAAATGGTEFMVLFAAFALVLSRYSGEHRVLVGTPVVGRDAATESTVGLMANTVVLHADLRGDPPVRDLLERVRVACLDAFKHQDIPFERLVTEFGRDQSRTPLFQVMLALNNVPPVELRLPGLRCTVVAPENPTAKFDVVLNLVDGPDRIEGTVEFDRDVYDRPVVASLAGALVRTLAAFTDDPDRRLSDVDVLEPRERMALLEDFNAADTEYPQYDYRTCLHRLVEQAVDRDPEAPAVIGGGRSLTYRQLEDSANAVARELLGRGVRPDDVVGLRVERSLMQVIGELAILKAGAAILPLDPDWPPARLATVVADAGCAVVLDADALAEASRTVGAPRPQVDVGPDHLAYVVYTSGSSGQPKGVAVQHSAICNNLLWMQHDWPLDARDRLLHKTASTFDVSVKEIFWPLLAGGCVVLADAGSERDPQALVEQVQQHGITVIHFVPSMLGLVLDLVQPAGATWGTTLRYVMSGAETLTSATQRRFAQVSDAALLHMYGPTETAIAVTGWACRRGDPDGDRVPLGRPMPHCRLYVLDADLLAVPPMVWGELYVGGAPLARGYLGRPGETAHAFVPDPFARYAGARLYRTGDHVRHGPQGLLEFRGRADDQVKIRGFRVELGEVEAAARTHPSVRQAVVVVVDGAQPGAHLVAYAVTTLEPAALRQYLAQRLPQYMVPAAVVVLDRLPLNANGKVDRGALPAPGRLDREAGPDVVEPRDEIEQIVAEVWSEELGVVPIGMHDDFFALGGQSLQAARIVARLKERLDRDVPLRDLFAEPTVANLSQLLRVAPRAALPRITRVPRAGGEATDTVRSVDQ